LIHLGRYASQQASEVLALPLSLRRLMMDALEELLEREGGEDGGGPPLNSMARGGRG
jgi:hypothetical protein